jgi:hypothetical protein
VVDCFRLCSPERFPQVPSNETIPKAWIALSGEMFSTVLRRLSHRDIYERKVSPVFYTHRWSSSNDVSKTIPKASIALSGEMFLAVLQRLRNQEIYERKVSLFFCTHRRSSSNDVGRLDVPQKLAIKACRNTSHERIDSGARLLSHALAASLRCSCSSCRALSL